jgi:general secretion pathway protein D
MKRPTTASPPNLMLVLIAATTMNGCAGLNSNASKETVTGTTTIAPVVVPSTEAQAAATSGTTDISASANVGKSDKKPEMARMYKGTGVLVNPSQPTKQASGGNTSLNFEAADIRDIAKTVLAEILKESYIVDPKVGGTISFRTTSPLPREALLPTLETVLRMNGVVMIKENGIYKIMPAGAARGSLSPRMGGALAGYSTQVVPLKYIGATEMTKLLEPFSPDPTAVKADELRNLLILSGTQNELQHMLDTIDLFDVDWLSGMSIGLFTLQSTDVKAISAEVGKIFADKTLNPLAGVVRIVPIERLNAFVIITPQPHYLEQAKIWLERLDKAGGTSGTRLFVYQVQNGKAEHLAELLNQTFGGGSATPKPATAPTVAPGLTGGLLSSTTGNTATAPKAAATPVAGSTLSIADDGGGKASEVRVVADKDNNSLLILANSAGYEKIEAALKKLDVSPRQVLIEVTIAEVTLTDDLQYGVEWSFTSGGRKTGTLDMGKVAGFNNLVTGFSYSIKDLAGNVKALLTTLASNNKLNILSSPHIMVADNQTAKIQVGDSVPTQTSTTTNLTNTNSVTSTVQYLDTGVSLSVTPHINAGGLVNLDITQEVSTATPTADTSALNPTIGKRSAKTIVTVQSGETMVLGGLISEKNTNGSSGIPFLSQIPILGAAFGTQSRNATKTELILLITPRVAANQTQGKEISQELRRKMGETKDLIDCGPSNLFGYTSRGGPFCLQARRYDGSIDKMREFDGPGEPVYLKDEAKRAQEDAQRALDQARRDQEAAQQRLSEASLRVKETQGVPSPLALPAPVAPTQPAK